MLVYMTKPSSKANPTKAIVFDFGRTIYDPDSDRLVPGALELLNQAHAQGYICLLLTKAGPGRLEQLKALGLTDLFDDIVITTQKSVAVFQEFANRFGIDTSRSFVIGDRAQNELAFGAEAGWPTIWFRSGKFRDEMPLPAYPPTLTVTTLAEATALI